MFDSTRAALIPAGAAMVAGYVTGRYAWSSADWHRFPHAAHVRIDVDGTAPFASDVADVERYDLTPQAAVEWVQQRQARGWWSCVYVDRSNLGVARHALDGLDVEFWVADWTGSPHVVEGPRVCAVQYLNTPDYDLSDVPDSRWFPTPKAA